MKPSSRPRDQSYSGRLVQHVGCAVNAVTLYGVERDGRTVGIVARCACGARMQRGRKG